MKKAIFMMFAAFVAFGAMVSCKCQQDVVPAPDEATVVELVPENTISADREFIFTNYGEEYSWFETDVVYGEFFDADAVNAVKSINSVYQVIVEGQPEVILSFYNEEGSRIEVRHDFWVGDYRLNDAEVKLTFAEAFERMNAANYPKPHSRHCVLRKEIGPVDANAQYVFGNQKAQIYVDAVTGDVTDENPAFKGFEAK